jgi:hypothetical protein
LSSQLSILPQQPLKPQPNKHKDSRLSRDKKKKINKTENQNPTNKKMPHDTYGIFFFQNAAF